MTLLSRSPTHQFSIDKVLMCSIPFPSTVYWRIAPLTMNAKYLHTSPSCKKYCRFRKCFGTKVFLIASTSPLVSSVTAKLLIYLIRGSCMSCNHETACYCPFEVRRLEFAQLFIRIVKRNTISLIHLLCWCLSTHFHFFGV